MDKEELARFVKAIGSAHHGSAYSARSRAKQLLEREQSRFAREEPPARLVATHPFPKPLGALLNKMRAAADHQRMSFGWEQFAELLASMDEPTRYDDEATFRRLVADCLAIETGLYRTAGIRPERPSLIVSFEDRPVLGTMRTAGPNAHCMLDASGTIPIVAFEAGIHNLIDLLVRCILSVPPFFDDSPDPFAWRQVSLHLRKSDALAAGKLLGQAARDAISNGIPNLDLPPLPPRARQVADTYARAIRCFVLAHELAHAKLGHLGGQRSETPKVDELAADDLALFTAVWTLAYCDNPIRPRIVVGAVATFFSGLEIFGRLVCRLLWNSEDVAVQDSHPAPLDRLCGLADLLRQQPGKAGLWPGFSLERIIGEEMTHQELWEVVVHERRAAIEQVLMTLEVASEILDSARHHMSGVKLDATESQILWFAPTPQPNHLPSLRDVANSLREKLGGINAAQPTTDSARLPSDK
jgi:hypothetical protein